MLGDDPRLLRLLELVRRVADTDATVLINGETGTGKEVVARLLHGESRRRREPFLAVNCGAIPESLQEAEMFGATRGAFTGAAASRAGVFEAATRGTVFLDEVASMGHALQVALLRVLQSGEFTPIGSTQSRVSGARIIAAANVNLQALVASGQFRSDLYYRLNVIQLDLPPLRERRGDIAKLVAHFAQTFCARYGKPPLTFAPALLHRLCAHDYPGNVRELQNLVHRLVLLAGSSSLTLSDLPYDFQTTSPAPVQPARLFRQAKACVVEGFERAFLSAALARSGGVIADAARDTGLSERVFHVKVRKYALVTRAQERAARDTEPKVTQA